jgi:hypothetical protein
MAQRTGDDQRSRVGNAVVNGVQSRATPQISR